MRFRSQVSRKIGGVLFDGTKDILLPLMSGSDVTAGLPWTPVLTFATPGDLAVTYSTQFGRYTRLGTHVFGTFNLITSAFTWTTAAGALTISGLPIAHFTLAGSANFGPVIFSGITKAGYGSLVSVVGSGTTTLTFTASGSGVGLSTVVAADVPSAGVVILQGNFAYEVAA